MRRMIMKSDWDTSARWPVSVLDAIGIGLLLVDEKGEVLLQNAIAEDLLTRKIQQSTLLEVLVNDALKTIQNAKYVANEIADQRKVEAYDESGKKAVIGYRFVRSNRLGVIFTLRDITEAEQFRANQRQLERLSQVGKACAMVAHEIGNPLAAIKATIQSIEREAAAAGLKDPISAVYWEIDRLDKILNQLLGFVRHRPPHRQKTDLLTIVQKAQSAVGARLNGYDVRVSYGALEPIYVDADQISQVLINLLVNSADAMPNGGRISISAGIEDDRIVMRVEDEGPGIAPELREQVFESFYTTKPTGTGLGLSICYRIVSDHGGTVSVEDRKEKGTSILVVLPKKLA
jgi:signal transduction histidine kinase